MKVRRDVASLPLRTAQETWESIVKLITGSDSVNSAQLHAATSIVSSAIADEHCAATPIVIKGGSSRLVIYTAHGPDAMELGLAVDKLTWNPTASDTWAVTVPCSGDDVDWMTKALAERAPRITVQKVDAGSDVREVEAAQNSVDAEIDWSALEKA